MSSPVDYFSQLQALSPTPNPGGAVGSRDATPGQQLLPEGSAQAGAGDYAQCAQNMFMGMGGDFMRQDRALGYNAELLALQQSLSPVHHLPGASVYDPYGLQQAGSSPFTEGHIDLPVQHQYLLALQSYLGAFPLKLDDFRSMEGRSHRRRFGEAGGRYRGREYLDVLGFPENMTTNFVNRQPATSADGDGMKKESNATMMASVLNTLSSPSPPDQIATTINSSPQPNNAMQNSAPVDEASSSTAPSTQPQSSEVNSAADAGFGMQEVLQSESHTPANEFPVEPQAMSSANSTQYSSANSQVGYPPMSLDFMLPAYNPPWDVVDVMDGAAFIERLCEQTDAEAIRLNDRMAQVPPEQTEAYHLVKNARIVPDEGYDMQIMRPYNPQMSFLSLVAKEIQYTEKHAQSVKLSQRRKGNLRFMSRPDYRPDYPGLLDDCSIYALDLRNRSLIADFKRCGDNEVQYSFGKPMTKKVHQLLDFNGLRYTEYYSTCQGVLVCPHAGEETTNDKQCTLLKATSSRCRTCSGHGCALKHLKCDVRLIKYVLEPTQPTGACCADPREKYLLVCVGQHRHPLPPPTNLPFKLVWAIESYVESNEKITAAELWPKIRHLHPTLASKDTVREIVRQVRSKRACNLKEKSPSAASAQAAWAYKPLYDQSMMSMGSNPSLFGLSMPLYQQQAGLRMPVAGMPMSMHSLFQMDDGSSGADNALRSFAYGASPYASFKMPTSAAAALGANFGLMPGASMGLPLASPFASIGQEQWPQDISSFLDGSQQATEGAAPDWPTHALSQFGVAWPQTTSAWSMITSVPAGNAVEALTNAEIGVSGDVHEQGIKCEENCSLEEEQLPAKRQRMGSPEPLPVQSLS